MEKQLIKQITKMSGTTLGIGIDNEKIKDAIQKNENIKTCYLLEENTSKTNKKKMKFNQKLKTVNIKKIRKIFKKKRIENLICNYKTIKPFLKNFIKDSVYINKGKLYIYGDTKSLELLIAKYQRYTKKIELIKEKNQALLTINNKNTTNNFIKDIGYWWVDTSNNILDFLTELLAN